MTAYQVSSEIYGGFFYSGITLTALTGRGKEDNDKIEASVSRTALIYFTYQAAW